MVIFFLEFFKLFFFCFVVAMCDPLHDMETIHGLLIIQLQIAVSQASLIFKKSFKMLVVDN